MQSHVASAASNCSDLSPRPSPCLAPALAGSPRAPTTKTPRTLNLRSWEELGYVCYQGPHLAQVVMTSVIATAFVVVCALFALVFYDSNSVSSDITAKAHGRLDLLFVMLKTVLVVFVGTFPSALSSSGVLAIIVAVGVVWTASFIYFMPFFDHRWNQVSSLAAPSLPRRA